jgi:hypothetical protein
LGEKRITSLDDGTKGAQTCKSQYDLTRLSELRSHRWGFAMKRAQLGASATPPAFGFANSFPFPTDLVRLDFVGDTFAGASTTDYRSFPEATFAVEGRNILTDMTAPLDIRYIGDISDATQFDALFVDALAHRLAVDVCMSMTDSSSKKQTLGAAYAMVIADAIAVNAIERPPDVIADDSWILVRP